MTSSVHMRQHLTWNYYFLRDLAKAIWKTFAETVSVNYPIHHFTSKRNKKTNSEDYDQLAHCHRDGIATPKQKE